MSPVSASGAPHEEVKTVSLRTFGDHETAQLAAANLRAHDIECWISADDCGGMYPNLTAAAGVRLRVRAADAEAALALLDAPVSPAEIKQIETEAGASPQPIAVLPPKLAWGQIAAGLLLGIIFCLLYQWGDKPGTKTFNRRTADDRTIETVFYRDGRAVKSIKDRNLDGRADEWIYYENGHIVRVEYDENFDGKPDLFVTYSNDLPASAEADTDFNGIPDVFSSYQNGMVKQVDYRPNGSKFTTTREIFQNGVLTEIWRGGDRNGNFSEVVQYDPFFNPMSTNPPAPFQLLSAPSQ
jgi:hypothetical protein